MKKMQFTFVHSNYCTICFAYAVVAKFQITNNRLSFVFKFTNQLRGTSNLEKSISGATPFGSLVNSVSIAIVSLKKPQFSI